MDEQSPVSRDDTARTDHQFRQGVESAATAMGFLDREGHWLRVNQRFCSLLGYSPADIATQTLFDLLDPHEQRGAKSAILALLSGRMTSYDVTTCYRCDDGRQIWLDLSLSPLDGTDPAQSCFFAVIHDVTRHHDAARQQTVLAQVSDLLAAPEDLPLFLDQLAQLTARAFDGWVTIDLTDRTGKPHRVAVSHPDPVQAAYLRLSNPDQGDDVPRRDLTPHRSMVVPLITRGTRVGMLRVGALDGNRRYDTQDWGLTEEIGRRCTLVIDNARLLAAERHAVAQSKAALALRDQFLSIAAHEFKTPLTSILGMSQIAERILARDQEPDRERLHRNLGIVVDQAKKLAKLVDQVFDLARWEEDGLILDRRTTDLTSLVESAVALVRATDATHPIVLHADSPLTAQVDPLRLEQALLNLLDNAARYSPDGSLIEVDLGATPVSLTIAVTDHGIGIPSDRRAQIFERYAHAHDESHRSGLGLGLFLSRQIVERHGGTLTVDFPEAGGTCFLIQLPLA